ncbi:hypothetical protein RIF23_17975 [Lipingzhangella sp. LS1_29]|uniref:ARB-07466-like C-terminal domain-containing protein n=1 Tax=Lipingzhangella rawalii TaxID=2055835 RepID=A0ABU2HBJ4_9ACTN|nr:hypothetical protein [Lipingzhangella rawalii]MDS1272180.1 hypothetical protein [Lipingzhangella rawalii]
MITNSDAAPSPARPWGRRLRHGTGVGLLTGVMLGIPGPAHAEPEEDLEDLSLEELQERAAALEEDYDDELIQFTNAEEAVTSAEEELAELEEDLDEARERVRQLAASTYTGSGVDPALEIVLDGEDLERTLADASMADHLAQNDSQQIDNLIDLQQEAQDAEDEAAEQLAEAADLVDDLEEQRDDVLDMIERYEQEETPAAPEDDTSGTGGGEIGPAGAEGPGFHEVTPRMAAVRDEIIDRFGAPYPVGCYRPGDPGDHGSGRACDFMMSANGQMPTPENQALGQEISDYLVANADRLGVKYVIWEQQIWDARNSSGWTAMEDRGGITANHYDHPHVSVF